jgi:drug/metabolite transporter (DMT)-like permease
MQMNRIVGAVLFAVGVVFLIFAYRAANAPLDRLADTFTGHYTSQTMWFLIVGVAGAVGGGLLFAAGRRV